MGRLLLPPALQRPLDLQHPHARQVRPDANSGAGVAALAEEEEERSFIIIKRATGVRVIVIVDPCPVRLLDSSVIRGPTNRTPSRSRSRGESENLPCDAGIV